MNETFDQASKGKLSVIYGDLHLLKSQLLLNEGEFWLSTWEQELAIQSTQKDPRRVGESMPASNFVRS